MAVPELNACFEDSRRLTGPNRYFASAGAVLDVITERLGSVANDPAAHARWLALVQPICVALGWSGDAVVSQHHNGTLLAIAAPADQLFTATEVNEWAWEQASGIFSSSATIKYHPPFDQVHQLDANFSTALTAFQARADAEKTPALTALIGAAHRHGLPVFVDDTLISIGAGEGSRTWALAELPVPEDVPWQDLHNIPTVLVTGSNGKTTTVRLLAALLTSGGADHAHRKVGYSCTEGVVVNGQQIESGDYSGPAGARSVLRHPDAEAAVLETARGGILRRGLAVETADVAIITNVSADHFGEYGIDNIEDLADVKLVVARALSAMGTLVLNADDPVLLDRAARLSCPIALFALDDNNHHLVRLRQSGGATCAVKAGELILAHGGAEYNIANLGKIVDMPLTISGVAEYNIANIAAAALAAAVLNVDVNTIVSVLRHFGEGRLDNPGRLERWDISGMTVLVDYAHNPEGLAALLRVSQSIQHQQGGRLGLLLGQAGNRGDEAIRALAHAAAEFLPDRVVIKEIASMLRGREWGEMPAMLQAGLADANFAASNIEIVADEVNAARCLLQWAKPGDVVVLPIHQMAARAELAALLDEMVVESDRARGKT